MSGPLRAMAYRVAAATGFRVAELRSLTAESFRLQGPDPSIFLRAGSTKNRRPAEQPIPASLARDLASWLRELPEGVAPFPLHHETAKAIRVDLEAAGIPYATDEGVADFHSLRAYYVSALVRSGASIKEVQTLARHAKPQTTLNHYAKVSVRDLRGAVECLPAPRIDGPDTEPAALAATGTEARPIKERLAHHLPTAEDGSGRTVSETGGMTLTRAGNADTPETLPIGGVGRVLSVPDGSSGEGGIRTPDTGMTPYNGLANRRFQPLSHLSSGRGAGLMVRPWLVR